MPATWILSIYISITSLHIQCGFRRLSANIHCLCNCEFCDMNMMEQSTTQFDCMLFGTFGMNSEEILDSVSIWTFRISLIAFIMNILPEIPKLFWRSVLFLSQIWMILCILPVQALPQPAARILMVCCELCPVLSFTYRLFFPSSIRIQLVFSPWVLFHGFD